MAVPPFDRSPAADEPAARRAEIEALKARLAEAEETLDAIRSGGVDAVVVGDRIYTLEGVGADSNRFRGEVIAQMGDAVIVVDNDQRITYVNPAAERLYGATMSQALGQPVGALLERRWPHPDDERRAFDALAEGGRWHGRLKHVARGGEEIEVESSVTVLRDHEGRQTGMLAVVRDVSERVRRERDVAAQRRATERALREADRRKDEFLATLAHELRNPLAPIRNALHIMQLTDDVATHEGARHVIERQLQQMVHLVDDLLDVSRISQGKIELRREHVDLYYAAQEAVETSRPLIDEARHQLLLDLPPPRTLIVDADLTRLCQAIANVLNNAAKYTPPGGRIELSIKREDGFAEVSVRDSGIGIPPDMLPRVFDMFAQVKRARDRSQGGLGIGLALVKRLVEMHGGSVRAESTGPGEGSRFVLRLPCITDADCEPPPELALAAAGADNGLCVLVADDNTDSAESLSQALRLMGYDTLTAHDGAAAVDLLQAHRPQAAILDIGMPVLNGLEAARRIRGEPGGDEVLLVALSGWGQEADRHQSIAAGFDHHLVKPVDIETLTRLLAPLSTR